MMVAHGGADGGRCHGGGRADNIIADGDGKTRGDPTAKMVG